MNVNRFTTTAALFQFVTDHFFDAAREAINRKGKFNVAVSGGSTPAPFFKALAAQADSFDGWNHVNFFWVDERWVPVNHSESNFGQAMQAGLNKLPANFYPFNTTLESPALSSKMYAEQTSKVWISSGGLDLILLGAGADGHTASVFNSNLTEGRGKEIAFATVHPQSGQVRLSLTLTTIEQSKEVWLILTGEEKKLILASILQPDEPHSPIQWAMLSSLHSTIVTDIHE